MFGTTPGVWTTCLDMILGVITLTWLPAGIASASAVYAITVRRHPVSYLRGGREDDFIFVLMAIFGWVWFVIIFFWLLTEKRHRGVQSAGLLFPGPWAREEAERLRLRLTLKNPPRRSKRM